MNEIGAIFDADLVTTRRGAAFDRLDPPPDIVILAAANPDQGSLFSLSILTRTG
jgi:hypothetical protein